MFLLPVFPLLNSFRILFLQPFFQFLSALPELPGALRGFFLSVCHGVFPEAEGSVSGRKSALPAVRPYVTRSFGEVHLHPEAPGHASYPEVLPDLLRRVVRYPGSGVTVQ